MLNLEEKWECASTMLTLVERGNSIPIPESIDTSSQWYRHNPCLQKTEIEAMARINPKSKMGYLPNGRMAWLIRLCINGARREWAVLAVYDDSYSNLRMGWDGGIRFYPVIPNYQDMLNMVNESSVQPKSISHILRDEQGSIMLSIETPPIREVGQIRTAASCIQYVKRWIMLFELGLSDQTVWNKFHGF